jgi:hypothetical protein
LSKGFGIALEALLLHALLAGRGATDLSAGDLHLTFIVAAVMSLLSLAFCLPLPADIAAELSGHRPAMARAENPTAAE